MREVSLFRTWVKNEETPVQSFAEATSRVARLAHKTRPGESPSTSSRHGCRVVAGRRRAASRQENDVHVQRSRVG